MAKIPRKARQTDGVVWSCTKLAGKVYLLATASVMPGHTKLFRVKLPGAAALGPAVNLIQGRINQQRYAMAH